MLRRFIRYTSLLLVFMVLGLVYVVPAAAANPHALHTGDDYAAVSCQVVCQSASQKTEEQPNFEDDSKDDEKDFLPVLDCTELACSGVGLLQDNAIWKLSSWVPPDLLLQSGAYTTSL